jgi:hypothetical protein
MSLLVRMARGAQFKVGTQTPPTTVVGALTGFSYSGAEVEEIDVSTLDSPGTAKEYMMGSTDYGSFTLSGDYVSEDEGQQFLDEHEGDGVLINFEISLPLRTGETTPRKISGSGYVKGVTRGQSAEEGSVVPFEAEIRVSGALTKTEAQ